MAQRVVVDANLCVALIIPLPYSEAAAKKWLSWETDRVSLYAPFLWEYEVVSALRKAIVAGLINREDTESVLQRLFILGVETVPPDIKLHDGQYLALAEALRADLWTADKRLIDVLKSQNLPWLHWIGDLTSCQDSPLHFQQPFLRRQSLAAAVAGQFAI